MRGGVNLVRTVPIPTVYHMKTLFLVTKVPALGHSKTRLGRTVGNDLAYEFAQASLLDLMERLATEVTSWQRLVVLYFPAEAKPRLVDLLERNLPPRVVARWELELFNHKGNNDAELVVGLGVGLANALFGEMARGATMVGFMGMDSPQMPSELLNEAAVQSTICAARDGGYTLLSVEVGDLPPARAWDAFANIDWSTPQTMQMQLLALTQSFPTAPQIHSELMLDVDEEQDLRDLFALYKHRLGNRVVQLLDRLPQGSTPSPPTT
ncbi:hypothetical protein BASA81_013840 [Batrachochytrium salamandrivorans]|nr:hypothetical protein BASA81_013840 [Batrachochytrium salamandrivorans]